VLAYAGWSGKRPLNGCSVVLDVHLGCHGIVLLALQPNIWLVKPPLGDHISVRTLLLIMVTVYVLYSQFNLWNCCYSCKKLVNFWCCISSLRNWWIKKGWDQCAILPGWTSVWCFDTVNDSKSIWLVKTCSNFPQRFCVGVQPQPGVYTERKYSYTKPDCVMAFKWQSLLWLIAWSSTRLGQRRWLCANGWLNKCSKPQRMGRNVQRPREFKVCSLLYYRYRV